MGGGREDRARAREQREGPRHKGFSRIFYVFLGFSMFSRIFSDLFGFSRIFSDFFRFSSIFYFSRIVSVFKNFVGFLVGF